MYNHRQRFASLLQAISHFPRLFRRILKFAEREWQSLELPAFRHSQALSVETQLAISNSCQSVQVNQIPEGLQSTRSSAQMQKGELKV